MRFVSWLAHIWFWLRRVWTSIPQVITTHLFRTCIATTVAGIVAYLPFIVSAADALLWDQMGWWKAFGSSIEYGYHGGIAVAVTGCLCYFEHEAEVPLGPVAGAFASMSFLGCLALVIFFIVGHGHAEAMRDAFSEGNGLSRLLVICILVTSAFSFLTVAQVRRAKDRFAGKLAHAQ